MWFGVLRPMAPGLCGFLPHRQSMDIAEGMQEAFRMFLACLDVSKAFDALHSWVAEAALVEHDAPAWLIAAVLKEMVGQ